MKKITKKATETKKASGNEEDGHASYAEGSQRPCIRQRTKAAALRKLRTVARERRVEATAKPAVKKATSANGKGATILALIARKGGATATELQEATGWQAHSIRGFLSTANKRGTKIASAKREDGQRVYSAQA